MRYLALSAAFALALTGPALADAALDRIFNLEQLDKIEAGNSVTYTHRRFSPVGEKLPDIEDGSVTLAIKGDDERVAIVEMNDGARKRKLEDFPGNGGNPVLMAFLELVTSAVSKGTGGSPFYIRNRIKDSFTKGTEVEAADGADRVVYRPFDSERNTARLGPFVGLELSFVVDDDAPGGFRSMSAKSGGNGLGYSESFELATGGAEK